MIQDIDKDISTSIYIETHIIALLEAARTAIERVEKAHCRFDWIKITYKEEETSLGSKYYQRSLYKDTNELLQCMNRWVRLFIKDNSNIDFTNDAFKNFKFSFF